MSELSREANDVLNRLASMPRLAKKAVTRNLMQEILLYTDGVMFLEGRNWPVKSRELGAGIYEVSLAAPIRLKRQVSCLPKGYVTLNRKGDERDDKAEDTHADVKPA